MTTRPLGPPEFIADDPGPWSMVTHVYHLAGRPGRRRPPPPAGLMLSPPPDVGLAIVGTQVDASPAGAGPVRVVAAAREPAFALSVDPGGDLLRGISPYVLRTWSLPHLVPGPEERPGSDPAASLPSPTRAELLAAGLPEPVAQSPGNEVLALFVHEARHNAIALVRTADGAILRWIRGARAAAWSPDGSQLALGGEWGVMLLALSRRGA